MHNGFIALHRKLLQNPIFDNPNLLKMWLWCLLKATHTEHKQLIGLEVIELKKGQFITGRFSGANELKVNESTWYKHIKLLEQLEMITLKSNNKYTVVSVVNWELYQVDKKENNNKITTKEQQNNTNNNVNNVNKEYCTIVSYLNDKTNKKFKASSSKTKSLIDARYNEGYTLDDFKKVIDVKVNSWLGNIDMEKYLRPETLFSNKFESYLNEGVLKVEQPNNNWRGTDKRL